MFAVCTMKKKRLLILLLITSIVLAFFIYNSFFKTTVTDIESSKTDVQVTGQKISSSFLENEKLANSLYKDNVVEIEGRVKEVNFLNDKATVLLNGKTNDSNILCAMQPNQTAPLSKVSLGQKIIVKGTCKGFLKDVILLNCIVLKANYNE